MKAKRIETNAESWAMHQVGARIPLTDMGEIGILGRAITGRAPCPSRYSQHKAQAAAVMRPSAAITTATRYYLV